MSTTHDTRACLLVSALLLWPACSLIGVEPDEIDVADETGGDTGLTAATNGGDGDGDPGGDGDGDPGDGDGSPGDGDGDGSPGDGDGDGDGSPGDGDGSPGDGDGDEFDCESLEPEPIVVGDNAIVVPDQPSAFEASCGSPGPEALLQFTAPSDGDYGFTLTSEAFEGVLVLVGPTCEPLEELACVLEGQPIERPMMADEIVFVIVDSDLNPGAATVTVTGP